MIKMVVCRGIQAEAERALVRVEAADVKVVACQGNCRRGHLNGDDRAWIERHQDDGFCTVLLGQCPLAASARPEKEVTVCLVGDIAELFIGREAHQALLDDRCFVVTTGWVLQWGSNLERLGLDAGSFDPANEGTMREVVMRDTFPDPRASVELEGFSKHVGLPARVIKGELDRLDDQIRMLILRAEGIEEARRLRSGLDSAEAMIADYAMAFDLLGSIGQAQGEEAVIRSILELFEMLFTPRAVRYVSLDGGGATWATSTDLGEEGVEDVSWIDDGKMFKETERGFAVVIQDKGHPLGVVEVMEMGFPENRHSYLNLAINISGAFALAISNARAIQEAKRSEEAIAHRLQVESMISDISSRFANSRDPTGTAGACAQKLVAFASADRIHILNYHRGSDTLETWVRTDGEEPSSITMEEELLDTLRTLKKTIAIAEPGPVLDVVSRLVARPGTRSLLLVPLVMGRGLRGILLLESDRPAVWSGDVRTVAQILAENIIAVLERQEDRDDMARLNDSLRITNKIMRHDIRNELTATQGFVQLFTIKNDELYLQKALRSIDKVHGLLQQMKEVDAFLLSGDGLHPQDLRSVIDGVLPSHNIRYRVDGDGSVLADGALSSVIDNLVRNAIVHGAATTVDFLIQHDGINVDLRVRDNGKGIPPQALGKIFQEGSSFGDKRGTGIGLFLIRKTMERFGGIALVEETSPNGTTFLLRLPGFEREGT
jgi:signal transduction histidine kinase